MKYLLALMLLPSLSFATPYFRPLDVKHPQWNIGACADPVNVGHSQQCSMVAVITHSHNDGYLLFPGEDWALLSVGYSASGEGASMALGPSWNLSPALGQFIAYIANTAAPSSKYAADLASFAAAQKGGLQGSFGPAFVYDPFYGNGGKGYFRIFAGATWKF